MIPYEPHSAEREIELASPRPAKGETTRVVVRRDTLVILSFNKQILSRGKDTYNGLKIPKTSSVNKEEYCESGKKLLHLQVRVLGATTQAPYAKLGWGIRTPFPTFVLRATSSFHKRTADYSPLSPWPAVLSIASRRIWSIGE